LLVVASLAILFHLAAITLPALAMSSGPWPTPTGRGSAEPPQFARSALDLSTLHAKYLRIAHSHHTAVSRPGDLPAVKFEVHLKDRDGNLLRTEEFPSPQANRWVRHRQALLASGLAPDLPVEPPGGEVIPAPGTSPPKVTVWLYPGEEELLRMPAPPQPEAPPKGPLQLATIEQHLLPRTRPVMRPLGLSLVLARSYARYLCRAHGAAKAEIVRTTRDPVPPGVLFGNEAPAQAYEPLVASFGEMSP
jgi:hypothetical protein